MMHKPTKIDRPWTEAELEYVAHNLALGYSYGQIAGGIRRSRSSVASAIRRMRGHTDKPRVPPAVSHSEASKLGVRKRVDQVAELMAEGFKLGDIAEELGVSLDDELLRKQAERGSEMLLRAMIRELESMGVLA